MVKFDSHDEAVAYLASVLSATLGDQATATTTAEAVADSFAILERPDLPPGTFGLMVPKMQWVIRDDDLKFADCFFKAVAAAASANFFFVGAISASAVVALLTAVFSLFNAARKKGARLTEEQCALLLALRQFGSPTTTESLAGRMGITPEAARSRLLELTKVRVADGSVVAVVAQDADGLWATAGI